MNYVCPVCGYSKLDELPTSPENGGSYEICPSCRFQFGYTDESEGYTFEAWRTRWIAAGMPWSSRQPQPEGWNPELQLQAVIGDQPT